MIVDISAENFQQSLIEASREKIVAIYFYADQIPECQTMGPTLEQQIGQDNPMLDLARVNVADPQLQSLAVQLGLQSVPAIVLFKDGRPLDALMGPQDEAGIKEFLSKHQPAPEDLLLIEAKQQLAEQATAQAYKTLHQAYGLAAERSDIKLLLTQACLELAKIEEAEALLATIPMVDQDSQYQSLQAQLDLAKKAADTPEIRALEEKLASEPDDFALKQELAIQYSQAGRKPEALELLFSILQKEMGFGDARKHFLDILATMEADPVASAYRRKIYSLMY
ncbi:tetratricopeptide repeat protein [Dongshaea marina]|uniref:tetratricopeptide repeat protein n=1 Tax=Dongshaea marina TaxID=2047966 RepID=UPI000D3E5E3E|nr:tetratricopeptide repeat protein [Dongshaea marina]